MYESKIARIDYWILKLKELKEIYASMDEYMTKGKSQCNEIVSLLEDEDLLLPDLKSF